MMTNNNLHNILKYTVLSLLSLTMGQNNVHSQVYFSDATSVLANENIKSGVTLAVCDMNNDGLDDLIRLHENKDLFIEYQQIDGSFLSYSRGTIPGLAWSIAIADVNNDQINDIFTGGLYDDLKLIRSTQQSNLYDIVNLDGLVFLQGSNCVDIDNDGHIDYFANHDDGVSIAYQNDQSGNFSPNNNLINPISTIPSDNSGNYSSIWTDYDNDGDLDMYLSKCRLGVSDPLDGRRINLMFKNNGDQTYSEVAEEIGLRPLAQSWTSDFGDIDNDGDLDVIVINHDQESKFYRNDNNVFTDITDSIFDDNFKNNPVEILQVKFADYDNDGFIDVFACGQAGAPVLLINDGNEQLVTQLDPFGSSFDDFQSAAVGDLNNDGFLDIVCSYTISYNVPSSKNDKMLFAIPNANNWISCQLEGTTSNFNGIGSRVELYGNWGKQIREVRSGEGYGVVNTMKVNFGIGAETQIDSLIVKWPSGLKSTIVSPSINQNIKIIEDFQCQDQISEFSYTLCNFDSIFIVDEYLSLPGTYSDTLNSILGCDSIIKTEIITVNDYFNSLSITICDGQSVNIGGNSQNQSGIYLDTLSSIAGCDSIIEYNLSLLPLFRDTSYIEICKGEVFYAQGQYQSESGLYTDSLQTLNGCDSLIVTDLFVKHVHRNIFQSFEICSNEEIIVHGNTYNDSSIFVDTLINRFGCDSIITTEISSLHAHENIFNIIYACQNDVINIHESEILAISDTIIIDTLVNRFGCDSIVTTSLDVENIKRTNSEVSFCDGDTLNIGAWVVTDNTIIYDTLTTSSCDSIHQYNFIKTQLSFDIILGDSSIYIEPDNFNYQWIDCMNDSIILFSNSSDFIPGNSGSYQALVTDSITGCTAYSECKSFVISSTLEIPTKTLHIYPIPSLNQQSITAEIPVGTQQLLVTNIHGQIVKSLVVDDYDRIIKLEVEDLTKGILFVKAKGEYGEIVQKIIIQ